MFIVLIGYIIYCNTCEKQTAKFGILANSYIL